MSNIKNIFNTISVWCSSKVRKFLHNWHLKTEQFLATPTPEVPDLSWWAPRKPRSFLKTMLFIVIIIFIMKYFILE